MALRPTRSRSIRRVREPIRQARIPAIDWRAVAPTVALTLIATMLAIFAVVVLLPMVLVLADVPYR
jgi:hypothetical protein